MEEQGSERSRRDYRLLAVMAFNLLAVWFLTGMGGLDIRHRLATMGLVALVVIPLTVLYVRGKWPPKLWLPSLVVIVPLWFATYSPLHEGSHLVGALVVGEKIVDFHLIPHFWENEFTSAWVQSTVLQGWRGAVPGLFPYFRDFLFLVAGWAILKSKRIKNCFLVGLVFVLFCLSPLFDIADNYVSGYLVQHARGNDFMGTAARIGEVGITLLGILLLSFASYVIARILWMYTDFPCKVAKRD